jgi:SAM-dependent methyltransferase
MASTDELKKAYGDQASQYNDYSEAVPLGVIEGQLFKAAIGDCEGMIILDLGGGAGLRARETVDMGASIVDVVDLTPEMMKAGQDAEAVLGRNRIRWFEADLTKPMGHLSLGTYDIVMANWLFDHAANLKDLEGMLRNVVAHLKPGGRFVGVRVANPFSPAGISGKYGIRLKDQQKIPGGVRFRYRVQLEPPIEFEASSMEIIYSGSTEMYEKHGLCDVEIQPYEDLPCVKDNLVFWKDFLDSPIFAVTKARKKM